MERKNKLLIIGHMILVALCALTCLYTIFMGAGSGGQQFAAAMCLAALVATAWYAIKGYTKAEAKAYKIMMLFCAAASWLCIVPHMYNYDAINNRPIGSILCTLGYALSFGLYIILALVQDLGKRKSNIISAVIFMIYLAVLVSCLILRPGAIIADGTRFDSMRIYRHITMLTLAINSGICLYFKYRDKEARGSK